VLTYLASSFNGFTDGSRRRVAVEDVGDENVVSCMDDESACLHVASYTQEGQETDAGFDDDLLFVLWKITKNETAQVENQRADSHPSR
jgi:hypothetical protein